ncbi:MAG: hypothetical protein ACLRIP_13540 [Blautia massiliensis (ex Durand et al. 2017)]
MNKKELRNMKLLEATDELIKLAKEDVPVRDEGYYTEQLIYQRGAIFTCRSRKQYFKSSILSGRISFHGLSETCIYIIY